jgi:hypothetical protein
MKKIFFLLLVNFSVTVMQAQMLSFKASTGDAELDGFLADVDVQAKVDINAFTKDVSMNFNIAQTSINKAIKILSPGDLFMAAQLSLSVNKPFETVVSTYNANRSKGWGVIAKEMGIKPGSPEFHAMKKAMKSKGPKNKAATGNGNSNGNAGKGKGKKK